MIQNQIKKGHYFLSGESMQHLLHQFSGHFRVSWSLDQQGERGPPLRVEEGLQPGSSLSVMAKGQAVQKREKAGVCTPRSPSGLAPLPHPTLSL